MFFNIHIKKIFQEHYQSVKRFGSRTSITDLGPNCLQRLLAAKAKVDATKEIVQSKELKMIHELCRRFTSILCKLISHAMRVNLFVFYCFL